MGHCKEQGDALWSRGKMVGRRRKGRECLEIRILSCWERAWRGLRDKGKLTLRDDPTLASLALSWSRSCTASGMCWGTPVRRAHSGHSGLMWEDKSGENPLQTCLSPQGPRGPPCPPPPALPQTQWWRKDNRLLADAQAGGWNYSIKAIGAEPAEMSRSRFLIRAAALELPLG